MCDDDVISHALAISHHSVVLDLEHNIPNHPLIAKNSINALITLIRVYFLAVVFAWERHFIRELHKILEHLGYSFSFVWKGFEEKGCFE